MEKLRNKLSIWLLMAVVRIANYRPKGWEVMTNGCCKTYSGKIFSFINPKPGMIEIEDIAKGLAYKPHFSGFSPKFFSIAEHCLLVEQLVAFYLVPIEHYNVIKYNDVSKDKEFSWLFEEAELRD